MPAAARRATCCIRRPAAGAALVRRFALPAVVLAVLVPNALATVFNIAYNRSEIIAHMPGAEPVFWNVQAGINAFAFPLGVALIALADSWPVARAVRLAGRGSGRTVRGRFAGASCWATCRRHSAWRNGCWPGWRFRLRLCAFLGPQPAWFFVRFAVSLALCGLIATVYPFFGVTFLAVRALLPALVRGAASTPTNGRPWNG